MSLQQRLDRIRTGFEEAAPAEVLEVMHGATRRLEESGIAERAVGEGDKAPDFRLQSSEGRTVALAEVLERGPVMLTFFRGHW